jgi:membrane fusion protein (multidrug efflux system)
LKKPIKIISLTLVLLVILAFVIIPKLTSKGEKTDPKQQNQNDQFISAEGYVVKSQTVDNNIKAVGSIMANEQVEVRSEVSHKIRGIYFKEGSYVRKGKLLFKLDSDDLTAKLRKLEVEEKLGMAKFERVKTLREKGLVSQEEYDISENTLEQIRADMSITHIDISKTYIYAPFSGIVGLRNVSIGAYAEPTIVLVSIQDVSKVKVDFSIPEKYIYLFEKGQTIKFKVDGVEGEFDGEVYAYEPKVENSTRTLILRAICINPGGKLLPGTFANVSFMLSQTDNAILVPTQSIVPKLKGQNVFVVKNGRAKSVDVEIADRTDLNVRITSGNISEGDTIITTNILRLKDNVPVKIVNAR